MRTKILLIALLLCCAIPCHSAPPASSAIAGLMDRWGAAAEVPYISVAVTGIEDLRYAGIYRHEAGAIALQAGDNETASFHAASISKLFTAAVIMQLRDEEKISLSDRVGTYVPAFRDSEIRIEHLLTHTSGLRDRKRAKGRGSRQEVDGYIKHLAKQKSKKPPGNDWHYADAGFNLLGRVIENVTAQSFSAVMMDRLLRPLEMKSSSFDISQIPADARVSAVTRRGKPTQHPWDLAFLPSSGLQTTATDLARFGRAVLAIASDREANGFLSSTTLKEMTVPRIDTEWLGVKQGYAWQLREDRSHLIWQHAGGEAGYETLLVVYPRDGLGIVAFGNRKDWPRFELVREIGDAYLQTSE